MGDDDKKQVVGSIPTRSTKEITRGMAGFRFVELVGLLAARSPWLRLALVLEIERHCSSDEILQGCLVDLVAFVDIDGAPDISFEAGVE